MKVPGWNDEWKAKKEMLKNSKFRAKLYAVERKKWNWSSELKGPLKIPRFDAFANFRVAADMAKLTNAGM